MLRPEAVMGGALHQSGGVSRVSPTKENEQEWHQHAARYLALDMPVKEVAEACGVCDNTIYVLQNTLWFQEKVCRIKLEMDRDVMEIFKSASIQAALKLVALSNTSKSEAIQLAATESILDRHLGKARQFIETDSVIRSADPVAEAEALRAEIKALEAPPASDVGRELVP